jgi:predicted ATP-binding protein involved in virulence
MRILKLSLENIGPFDKAELEFVADPEQEKAPVTLITGENGTGKSIILDAIRAMFGRHYCVLERPIWRKGTPFCAVMDLNVGKNEDQISARKIGGGNEIDLEFLSSETVNRVYGAPVRVTSGSQLPDFVTEFWRTTQATDSFEIQGFSRIDHQNVLAGSLQGTYSNQEVTNLICSFDYLRDAHVARDKRTGEVLFDVTKRIFNMSLLNGHFDEVDRLTFTPMVFQSGQRVPLANMSGGNAFLIQHMISLLGKMFSYHVLRGTEPEDICNAPGLLLIDEAENCLHPRWQKRFLTNVQSIFPNLQIIATTHSPFIVSSVPNARVFVCKFDGKSSVVTEETTSYANKPIDEILVSDAFDGTQPFSQEMTDLIEARKRAVQQGDDATRRRIEAQLQEKNPEYFSYFSLDERLRAVGIER